MIKGLIESYIVRQSSNYRVTGSSNNDYYVTLYNFLNNLSSIGVTRVAYNVGLSGTGMTYWDLGAPPGNGAWALFKFGNAQIPFYVLIASSNLRANWGWQRTSHAAALPCSDNLFYSSGATTNNGYYSVVSIAIAQRADGSNPWNGTMVNTGSDTKGTPVWTPGSSALAVYPRNNSTGGDKATNREAVTILICCSTSPDADTYPDIFYGEMRSQFFADENNLLIMNDGFANGSYSSFYFGKYVPFAGMNPDIPYVMLNSLYSSDPTFYYSTYGSASATTTNIMNSTGGDGGICHPTATLGVKNCLLSTAGTLRTLKFHPSKAVPNYGRFDTFPITVGLGESPYWGQLGTLDFIRFCCGVPSMATTVDKKLAILGHYNLTATKLIVPWDGITQPGSGTSRLGISF